MGKILILEKVKTFVAKACIVISTLNCLKVCIKHWY